MPMLTELLGESSQSNNAAALDVALKAPLVAEGVKVDQEILGRDDLRC